MGPCPESYLGISSRVDILDDALRRDKVPSYERETHTVPSFERETHAVPSYASRLSNLPKIIRPALVCRTLVTAMRTV